MRIPQHHYPSLHLESPWQTKTVLQQSVRQQADDSHPCSSRRTRIGSHLTTYQGCPGRLQSPWRKARGCLASMPEPHARGSAQGGQGRRRSPHAGRRGSLRGLGSDGEEAAGSGIHITGHRRRLERQGAHDAARTALESSSSSPHSEAGGDMRDGGYKENLVDTKATGGK